jgi:hypothetical protein
MTFCDRLKVFAIKWGVPFITGGVYEVTVVYECENCGKYLYDDDECPCIFVLPKEDDIN